MSKLGQVKKNVEYEGSVPRCFNCVNYKEASIRLSTNSNTFRKNQHCKRFFFTISPNGICKHWNGVDGSTLEDGKK